MDWASCEIEFALRSLTAEAASVPLGSSPCPHLSPLSNGYPSKRLLAKIAGTQLQKRDDERVVPQQPLGEGPAMPTSRRGGLPTSGSQRG